LMYGVWYWPFRPGSGDEKQAGLAYWFAARPLRGSQVKIACTETSGVPTEVIALIGCPLAIVPHIAS